MVDGRLDRAAQWGAIPVKAPALEAILAATGGRGADAVIDGQDVVVSSLSVPQPTAVRYAWSSNSPWANLFNKDGLPAQTFRTDDWNLDPRAK